MTKQKQKNRAEKGGTEVDGLKSQLARALADYDNLRKRVEREREEIVKLSEIVLFEKLLPNFDMLFSAQIHLKDEGLGKVIAEFEKTLESEGFVKIAADKGMEFDANFHEAVDAIDTEKKEEKGMIEAEILSGWKTKDGRIIRPAKVRVYR